MNKTHHHRVICRFCIILLWLACLLFSNRNLAQTLSQTFYYNGTTSNGNPLTGLPSIGTLPTEQTFIVPPCVTSVTVEAYGAAGGGPTPVGTSPNYYGGGKGAKVTGTITGLTPGQTLYVYCGGQGIQHTAQTQPPPPPPLSATQWSIPAFYSGGWNGGGNGGHTSANLPATGTGVVFNGTFRSYGGGGASHVS
ncbi:MAG: hypothetical protein ACKO2O_01375, partial [Crocinitomicaceae bacterium]